LREEARRKKGEEFILVLFKGFSEARSRFFLRTKALKMNHKGTENTEVISERIQR